MTIELQEKLLPLVRGKIHLHQTPEEQEYVVERILENEPTFEFLTEPQRGQLARDFLALDKVESFVRDVRTEDVMINSTKQIFTFNNELGMIRHDRRFENQEELDFFIRKMVVLAGKSEVKQVLDLHLPRNLRVNVVRSPFGPQITIRKMRETPPSIIDLVDWKMLDVKLAAELWLYIDGFGIKPANMIIGGGPGSGKTTLLNALFSFFPANERIVTIEDTIELSTETEENCSRLESTEDLSAELLVKNSLRMRPDRVIVGEVRGREASELMTAMNIGKVCMGTIHANTSRNIITRLSSEPMNITEEVLALIDVFIIVKAFPEEGRVHRGLIEIVEVAGREQKILLTSPGHYDLKARKLVEPEGGRTVFRDRLARMGGLRPVDVLRELETRARILVALRRMEIRSISEISVFAKEYYLDPNAALAKIGLRR